MAEKGRAALLSRRAAIAMTAGAAATAILPRSAAARGAGRSWIPGAALVERFGPWMRHHAVPGMAIAVVEDGALAWQGHYGAANIETGQAVDTQTLFQAASLSKPVFAYVVMQLVEEGRVALDDRVADYVRPTGGADDPRIDAVTVRHVLCHATGLPNWRDERSADDLLVPAFAPGQDYSYSGEAFYWLQQLVEAVTGQGIAAVMAQRLFTPAGLDMAMGWSPERDRREVEAHGVAPDGRPMLLPSAFRREHWPRLHAVAARWGRPVATWREPDFHAACAVMRPHTAEDFAGWPMWKWRLPGNAVVDVASSVRASPADYARFLALMMPASAATGRPLISDASRRLMLTPQLERADRPHLPRGIGWGLERDGGDLLFYHWGKNGRAHISVALGDPARRRGLVVMVNGVNGGALAEQVAAAMTGKRYASIS